MANSWGKSYQRVASALGMLAYLLLTVPEKVMANDTLNSQSPASTGSQQGGATSIVALLAKLDRQIEEDRPASVQNDLVAETVAHLLTLLPYAAPTDAELVFALPAHFAKRSREAEAGGRQSEANRFAAVGSVLEGVLKPMDTADPRAPMQATAGPPHAPATSSPSISTEPPSLPEDVAGDGHTPIDGAQDAAMTSPPSLDASPGQTPATLAGRAAGPHDAVPTGAPAAIQALDPTAARQQGAPPIVVLLAKLNKQIGADPVTPVDAVAETVADLLALLPNAPPSDAKLVLALPVQYATRAREAEAAGRFDEANRFAALGGALGDVLKGMVPEDGAAQENPQWPKAEPPATDSGSPAIAAAPALPPGDPVSEDDASVGQPPVGVAEDAAMTSPPSSQALPIQPQTALAGRASDSRPGSASTNVPTDGGQNSRAVAPATAQPQGAASVVALLANLDKQIATDPPGKEQDDKVAETVANILTILRDASPFDTRLIRAMPVHFLNRAHQADAGGRHDEANRFAMLAGLLEDLFNGPTLQHATTQQTPQQPKAERSTVVASANLSIAATPDQPSAELAGRAHDRSGVAVEPKPSTAKLAPPRTMEEPSNPAKNRPAESDGRKPPQTPELRLALRDMPSGADARPPLGEILISPERVVSPRAVAKMATAPAAPPPRVAVPASTRGAKSTANAVDPRCRAIVLKFEIGEEPSDAERTYLRHGCRQHG
jgi:hypothetical protein